MAFYHNNDEHESLSLYLEEINRIPLLTKEEEQELASRSNDGDVEARKKLIRSNLRFVIGIAKQYANYGLPLSDLINEGNICLIEASKRFDGKRGYKFISYAVWWIRQAIFQALAEQSRIVRLPLNRAGTLYKVRRLANKLRHKYGREATLKELAEILELSIEEVRTTLNIKDNYLSLDAPISSDNDDSSLMESFRDFSQQSSEEIYIYEALKHDIQLALETLSKKEAEITALYFGIGHEKAYTLEELGQRFNLSRERVRQIKEKAIRRLRHASRSKKLSTYL